MRSILIVILLLATLSCIARRSVDAVVSPQKFTAFEEICDSNCFDDAWKSNPAWMLSNFSHVAYYEKDRLCRVLVRFVDTTASCPSVGNDDKPPLIRIYDKGSAQGFLVVWPDKAVLSFRGTEPTKLQDIAADSRLYKVGEGEAKVHAGFKKELDKLWNSQILPDLQKYAKGKPVWATGHSLGAGMAVIAGMRYPFEEVVTFGEPRVGYGIETAFKAKSHTRIVNGDDPITTIPPKNLSKYIHHGNLQRICDPVAGANPLFDHAISDYSSFLMSENNACKK